jgi:hypothetical protein
MASTTSNVCAVKLTVCSFVVITYLQNRCLTMEFLGNCCLAIFKLEW